MPAHRIPLAFHTGPGGCWHCTSHALNADGYVRMRWSWGLEFLHRVVWRLRHGDIPETHGIDHLCGSRDCANPDHMRLLTRSEHAIHTNTTRYDTH